MIALLSRDRRSRTLVLAFLVLYAAVLFATPFLHHDFACHQRTPRHCPACVANPPAPRAVENPGPVADTLADAGAIEALLHPSPARRTVVSSPGRSPPA